MTLPIKYTPWHRFADWSEKGIFLPEEVLEKINEGLKPMHDFGLKMR